MRNKMKSKIASIKHDKVRIYLRAVKETKEKKNKNINRFKQEIKENFGVIFGFPVTYNGEFTEIVLKDKTRIQILKGDKYWHIILYGRKRGNVLKIFFKYFEIMEPKK